MSIDIAVHSDFLVHWTGKDIEEKHNTMWSTSYYSKTETTDVTKDYIKRLKNILKFGFWLTEESGVDLPSAGPLSPLPKTCFTELKLSESRRHAMKYGRLGIGVKRLFLFDRAGRPVTYFGFKPEKDEFLKACIKHLPDKSLLHFFKPMIGDSSTLDYELYGESEWRILFSEKLKNENHIVDPRDGSINSDQKKYFDSLSQDEQSRLKFLLPLDGWISLIIYPSIQVKNAVINDPQNEIHNLIKHLKRLDRPGNATEQGNWPIEVDLDACRNF